MKFDWKKFDGFLLFAAGATLLALLHPGDAAWTPAEAETVRLALEANAAGDRLLPARAELPARRRSG